jgi:hypothetical protein
MEHQASGEGTAGSRSHEEALADLKAAHKEHMKEEVEQLDELSSGTLKSYAGKAQKDLSVAKQEIQSAGSSGDDEGFSKAVDRKMNREAGIKKAKERLNKEEVEQVEERSMTDAEMKKREDIVKGMKKGIQGFKDRYGDKAKSVMYATATKQAMKEETQDHWQAGHDYAADHAIDSGFKETARARKKEMLADNPHKKGTPEHKEWHQGALAGHQTGLDNL